MRAKGIIILIMAAMLPCDSFSREDDKPRPPTTTLSTFLETRTITLGMFHLTSAGGNVSLGSNFRQANRDGNRTRNTTLYGKLNVHANAYIWHPVFLVLSTSASYNPFAGQVQYLVLPDQVETRTLKSFNLTATFFQTKPIGLSSTYSMGNSVSNRSDFSKINMNYFTLGNRFHYNNKYLPFSLGFTITKSRSKEEMQKATGHNEYKIFTASTSKSFTKLDDNKLEYTLEEQYRQHANGQIDTVIRERLEIIDRLSFGKKRAQSFTSRVYRTNERGSFEMKRLTVSERLQLLLPMNLKFNGAYNFLRTEQKLRESNLHTLSGSLQHQLYLSLKTTVSGSLQKTIQRTATLNNNEAGVVFDYTKKIPKGVLHMNFGYNRHMQNVEGQSEVQTVIAESHTLSDGQIELLSNANVDEASVVVRDVSGLIIYQVNIDYSLIKTNSFLEIRRTTNSLIANNQTVYVDYSASKSSEYSINFDRLSYALDIDLFKNLLNLNFRTSNQNYHQTITDNLDLATYRETSYGIGINTDIANGSVAITDRKSSILPYRLISYSIGSHRTIMRKLSISLQARYQDYYYNAAEEIYQKLLNVSFGSGLSLRGSSKINASYTYRSQDGYLANSKYHITEIEYTLTKRKLNLSLKVNYYNRIYYSSYLNFSGAFIKLTRRL